jgi:hypothetical protein
MSYLNPPLNLTIESLTDEKVTELLNGESVIEKTRKEFSFFFRVIQEMLTKPEQFDDASVRHMEYTAVLEMKDLLSKEFQNEIIFGLVDRYTPK